MKLRHGLFPALVVLVTGLLVALAARHDLRLDLTQGERNRLPARTRALLQTLPGPVEAEAIVEPYPVQRAALQHLLERFHRARPDFRYRFTDPAREPARMRALGIRRTPVLLLRHGGREERLTDIDMAHLSAALERLALGTTTWIGVLTGHGEARLHGRAHFGLGDFGRLLELRGYHWVDLDPNLHGQFPDNLDLLLVAGPRSTFTTAEQQRLIAWLQQGGHLLWLAESPLPDLLATALELRTLPGTVVDAAAASLGLDTPTVAVARPAGDHPLTRALKAPVLLPGAHALESTGSRHWLSTPLLATGPRSWNETGALRGVLQRDPERGERRGPLTLAWQLDALEGSGQVVVVGDADFLSNQFLGNGANRALGLALVHHLTRHTDLAALPPETPPDQKLQWSAATAALLAGFFMIVLPLTLALTGVGRAWWRRRR